MMARVGAEDDESFTFESAVRGHHVFKRIWTPVNGGREREREREKERGNK